MRRVFSRYILSEYLQISNHALIQAFSCCLTNNYVGNDPIHEGHFNRFMQSITPKYNRMIVLTPNKRGSENSPKIKHYRPITS